MRTIGIRQQKIRPAVVEILRAIGEDPDREGLRDTPHRVAKAFGEWTSGYRADIPAIMKTFKDGGETYDQMVLLNHIPVHSLCEHHLAPFVGEACVAYIPDGHIVGLSKLPRLVKAFSQRLQVQERLTEQIANAMWEHLKPRGVGVYIRAQHMCMGSRGICQPGIETTTSKLLGLMLTDATVRAEFLHLGALRRA
jgi:GTP cyclohydrolase I